MKNSTTKLLQKFKNVSIILPNSSPTKEKPKTPCLTSRTHLPKNYRQKSLSPQLTLITNLEKDLQQYILKYQQSESQKSKVCSLLLQKQRVIDELQLEISRLKKSTPQLFLRPDNANSIREVQQNLQESKISQNESENQNLKIGKNVKDSACFLKQLMEVQQELLQTRALLYEASIQLDSLKEQKDFLRTMLVDQKGQPQIQLKQARYKQQEQRSVPDLFTNPEESQHNSLFNLHIDKITNRKESPTIATERKISFPDDLMIDQRSLQLLKCQLQMAHLKYKHLKCEMNERQVSNKEVRQALLKQYLIKHDMEETIADQSIQISELKNKLSSLVNC